LADTVIAVKNRNNKARLVLSNNSDTGTQFFYMQSNGIDIRLKGFSTGLLHHKYAIVDAEPIGDMPFVITGSHNWSSSAENSNDENTLIIQDEQIANFYLQEFAARYYEAGGTDSIHIVTGVEDELELPVHFILSQNYPNPFNPVTTIKYSIPDAGKVELSVYNSLGERVAELVNGFQNAGNYLVQFNASALASGVYFYRITSGDFIQTKKLMLLK
jgi:hypothetical protein